MRLLSRRRLGIKCISDQYFPSHTCPKFAENTLKILNHWASRPKHHVSIFFWITRITKPRIIYCHTSGVSDISVNDYGTPMVACLILRKIPWGYGERMEYRYFTAQIL